MTDSSTAAVARDRSGQALPPYASRRTFAIISHPDAGKTTLTEKLLLFGGAIRMAGNVRARGERRRTQSDWMEIERSRGISITSSVMTFERDGLTFNLLDTPGHQDFSEDTYRTLTAVDSAIMVIDAAKGIEAQTKKLFEVCRLRDIPIITFINKVDREARDPFELLDEIESTLALNVCPMTLPIGSGTAFHGLYDLRAGQHLTSSAGRDGKYDLAVDAPTPDSPELDKRVPAHVLEPFREMAELAQAAYPEFDVESYREGHLTPVYFGSALKDYGVDRLLDALARFAPAPQTQPAEPAPIDPGEERVTGFVFKVQANMDPNHRDRVAFVRLVSGRFKRGMKLKQVRSGKPLAIANPIFFFAQERELAEEAYPGDIIGVPNHGTLRVGDALVEGDDVKFTGIPSFAPEILRRVRLEDPSKSKQLRSALEDLAEEGVVQAFRPMLGSNWIVGVVGQLQLEVMASRVAVEYKVGIAFEPAPFETARWVDSTDPAELKKFLEDRRAVMAEDRDGAPVLLARNMWELNRTMEEWPKVQFYKTRERA